MEEEVIDLTDLVDSTPPKTQKTNVAHSPSNTKQATLANFIAKSPNNNNSERSNPSQLDHDYEITKIVRLTLVSDLYSTEFRNGPN